MIVKNATVAQLDEALAKINAEKYSGNVIYQRSPEAIGRRLRFTLRVQDSRQGGARRGTHDQKRMVSACWHVHGELFDALFIIAPDAEVSAGTLKINADGGNWQDRNIGSMMQPCYFSEACLCEDGEPVADPVQLKKKKADTLAV